MIYRELGTTGEQVSVIGVGGFHLGMPHVDEALAIRIVRSAIDQGITFLDNCWDYNDGTSETRMGKALRDGYRERAFLMTKIDGRSKHDAARQLEESLRRLEVDHIDLVQHHEVIRYEDPDRIFHEQGAHAALVEAQERGTVRYLGFTGHKHPEIHLRMLELADRRGVRFDAVQLPVNALDAHFRSFTKQVVPELVRRKIGILGMKSMAGGVLLKSNVVTPVECLRYALNQQTSVVITGIDSMAILEQAVEAASTFRPLSQADIERLLEKTAAAARDGAFEPFKTTSLFDGTAQHPEWLGEEPAPVRQLME
ncbi:MAG: aldo/keto reductase [Candidatus Eisenbacteria bacterium]|uniref:Aldo/keto reductase n=1 Tax=Eiseniibacteriota bacterium TaxID=2212470 RepID=A0A538U065_UNCEI|nr:MAG: aldo/keto reductase [Candidatus Eisenbacteria bacterium]